MHAQFLQVKKMDALCNISQPCDLDRGAQQAQTSDSYENVIVAQHGRGSHCKDDWWKL